MKHTFYPRDIKGIEPEDIRLIMSNMRYHMIDKIGYCEHRDDDLEWIIDARLLHLLQRRFYIKSIFGIKVSAEPPITESASIKLYYNPKEEYKMPTERGLKGNFHFMFGFTPKIKKVIFNEPATIVYWDDNTKTVVKTNNGDEFDAEKGLAMAVVKKTIGYKEFYKVCEKDKDGNEAWPCKWEDK